MIPILPDYLSFHLGTRPWSLEWLGTTPFLEIVASEKAAVALFRKRKRILNQPRYYEVPLKRWPTAQTIMPFSVGINRSMKEKRLPAFVK